MTQLRMLGSHTQVWPERGPWLLTFHWAEIDGHAECVGLDIRNFSGDPPSTFRGAAPTPITASLVRDLPVGSLIAEASQTSVDIRRYIKTLNPKASKALIRLAQEQTEIFKHTKGRRRRHWTPERMEEVADVYRIGLTEGRKPTVAVAEHFHISHSMAGKLVNRARHDGFLGPTTRGKAGGAIPPKRKAKRSR